MATFPVVDCGCGPNWNLNFGGDADIDSPNLLTSLWCSTKSYLEKYFLTDQAFIDEYGVTPKQARHTNFMDLKARHEKDLSEAESLEIIEAKLVTFDRLKFLGVNVHGKKKCHFAKSLHKYIRDELDSTFVHFSSLRAQLDDLAEKNLIDHGREYTVIKLEKKLLEEILPKASSAWSLFMVLLRKYHHINAYIRDIDEVENIFNEFCEGYNSLCKSIIEEGDDSDVVRQLEHYRDVSFPIQLKRLSKITRKNEKVKALPFEGNGGHNVISFLESHNEIIEPEPVQEANAKSEFAQKGMVNDAAEIEKEDFASNEEAKEQKLEESKMVKEEEKLVVDHMPAMRAKQLEEEEEEPEEEEEEPEEEEEEPEEEDAIKREPSTIAIYVDTEAGSSPYVSEGSNYIQTYVPGGSESSNIEELEGGVYAHASAPPHSAYKAEAEHERDDLDYELNVEIKDDDEEGSPSDFEKEQALNYYANGIPANAVDMVERKKTLDGDNDEDKDKEESELRSKSAPENTRVIPSSYTHFDIDNNI